MQQVDHCFTPGYQGPFAIISAETWANRSEKSLNEDFVQKINQALRLGFFYLEIPDDCRSYLELTLKYANSFYANENIRKIKHEGFTSYNDRDNMQVESLYLEKKYWETYLAHQYPDCLVAARKMHQLSIEILKTVYNHFGIAESDHEMASGGLSTGNGVVHLTFHHYRHEKAQEGLAAHKDFGQVSVLFTDKKGLQAKQNEEWIDVPPLKDHFIINFGKVLEILINDPDRLIASEHRVVRLAEDRISFGVFTDNGGDMPLYQRQANKFIVFRESSQEFLQESFANVYDK